MDIKASRFLTHMKKLKDPEEPIERLAIWFAQAAERKRLAVSRVPRLRETPVG